MNELERKLQLSSVYTNYSKKHILPFTIFEIMHFSKSRESFFVTNETQVYSRILQNSIRGNETSVLTFFVFEVHWLRSCLEYGLELTSFFVALHISTESNLLNIRTNMAMAASERKILKFFLCFWSVLFSRHWSFFDATIAGVPTEFKLLARSIPCSFLLYTLLCFLKLINPVEIWSSKNKLRLHLEPGDWGENFQTKIRVELIKLGEYRAASLFLLGVLPSSGWVEEYIFVVVVYAQLSCLVMKLQFKEVK